MSIVTTIGILVGMSIANLILLIKLESKLDKLDQQLKTETLWRRAILNTIAKKGNENGRSEEV